MSNEAPDKKQWQPPRIEKLKTGASKNQNPNVTVIRGKIQPRSVKGYFNNWRIALVFFTQILFYGLPWLQWNGRQAVLFDLVGRKFYIFGMVLWPQDVIYLAVLLVLSAFSLFLFTAVAGRLFCGYACPQTVYTEIFMWIERKIEGDRVARMRLDSQPWGAKKIRIKATKHLLWIAVAWWTGSTFIGYFAPIRELGMDLINFQLGPWQWFWIVFYSVATWGNAGFLREAVCKYMCPYARFQSVMVDDDTFVVTYDHARGEPRGKRSRKVDPKDVGLGDCIDCTLCVQVCPTGIDIRDGLQYMCIGCGACVDACDDVMDKVGYERGLIRYTSGKAIIDGLSQDEVRKRVFRPRVIIYSLILMAVFIAFVVSLANRTTLRMDIIRDRGSLGREVAGGFIENVYRLNLINTSENILQLKLKVTGKDGLIITTTDTQTAEVELNPASNKMVPIIIRAPAAKLEPGIFDVNIDADAVDEDGKQINLSEKTSFYVPR